MTAPQMVPSTALSALLDSLLGSAVGETLDQMRWADDELTAAIALHPDHAQQIRRSHPLLKANPDLALMKAEIVYRAHCRELLNRVVTGQDTRPGTAAEICSALCGASLKAPLRSTGVGLYTRMWKAAGFPDLPEVTRDSPSHEGWDQSSIDQAEMDSRHKLAAADRYLDNAPSRD